MSNILDTKQLYDMLVGAKQNLLFHKSYVDELNVFPVPDGDTGTNMGLTITATVKEVDEINPKDISELVKAMAKGALKGARGNSGVILSQIIKGLSSVLSEAKAVTTKVFAKALEAGANKAYEAVTHPKEGTILTIIRVIGVSAVKIANRESDFADFFKKVLEKGSKALAETPKQLPILAEAGVVDSGGQGLIFILEGMYKVLAGIEIEEPTTFEVQAPHLQNTQSMDAFEDVHDLEHIEFAYCTEFFIINLKKQTTLADIDKLRDKLTKIGDCVLVVGDLETIKVHVHTNTPDKALGYALQLGELNLPKIENMLEQNRELQKKKKKQHKKIGMLAICSGEGFGKLFKEFNADVVLEGGQTMNPSVEDIIDCVKRINADNVFVLPNNKNIILACEQAQNELKDINLITIPSKNISQGVAAAIAFTPNNDIEDLISCMTGAINSVECIQVTKSVRDAVINGFTLKIGDVIALEDDVIAKGENEKEVILKALSSKDKGSVCVITLFYGEDVKDGDAEELKAEIEEMFPDSDVTIYKGGQSHYSYFISIE